MKICAKNEHIFKRYQNIDIFFFECYYDFDSKKGR